MPENVGEFEVVVKGRVDSKLGEELEQNIKKHSKRASEQTEKNFIEKFTNLGKKFNEIFKSTSLGKFLRDIEKLSTGIGKAFSGLTSKVSKTSSQEMPVSQFAISEEQEAGAAAGGKVEGAAVGGGWAAIIDIVGKLSIGIILLKTIVDAIMSLAPIQAILKMISAVLQLTLYPIAQFFLTILKPFIAMMIKYLIIPAMNGMKEAPFLAQDLSTAINPTIPAIILSWDILTAGFKKWWDNIGRGFDIWWGNITRGFDAWLDGLKTILQKGWTAITNIFNFNNIISVLQSGWNIITDAVAGFVNKLIEIANKIPFMNIAPIPTSWSGDSWGGDSWSGDSWSDNNYSDGWSSDYSDNQWANSYSDGWSNFGGGGAGARAKGGIVGGPTRLLVGEKGPEAIIPLPDFLTKGMSSLSDLVSPKSVNTKLNLGGISQPNITFNIDKIEKDVDIDEIVKKIERTLYINTKRAGMR